MRGWIVLAAVLLLLFLLGQLRLGAVGEYGPGGAGAWFRAGPVRIRLYPRRRSGPSKKEKAPKPGKEHPAGEARGGGLLELMKELLPLALEAAGCFRRRLRVDQLELKLTIGAADPGDAAIRYGQANALLGSIWQPLTEAFHVEEGRARVEVDFTDWGSGEQERENFRIVREGILGRRLLDFTYYASSGTRTRRRVEPGKLVFKSGCWYLQAFCLARRDWRIFRLARMEGLCLEREGFPPRRPPEQLEVPSPEQRQNGTLTLRFASSAAWRVRDYFAPGQIRAGEDGCLLVECDFPQDGWLLGFLLSFGDQVEVFAPASWREVLGRTGKKIAALYETGHSVSGIQAYPEGTEEGSTPPEQKEEPDMEERIFCQCCGMPLDAPEDMGSNADGSPNRDYCRWCYQRGAFTAPEATVEDMIAFDLKFNEENGHPFGPQEEAERLLRAWLPTLKRWRK